MNHLQNPQNYMKKVIDKKIQEDEYIVFHVDLEKIFIKKLTDVKLFGREHNFYLNFSHPFIPCLITNQIQQLLMMIILKAKNKMNQNRIN